MLASGPSCRIGALVLLAVAAPAFCQIPGIKVTTDTSIDCSSVQTIARDLLRGKETDEQKAIAIWYFVRRLLYHWPSS